MRERSAYVLRQVTIADRFVLIDHDRITIQAPRNLHEAVVIDRVQVWIWLIPAASGLIRKVLNFRKLCQRDPLDF